ncbi:uncharacterized protein LOC130693049 isoform X2 [Daphnia carinata]|uniref:uncharacterized protein LOC130693049 isoform X2 n=1 Tax=Daphnia carinata TaxID=120202 RepID=UPI00286902A2|nr:uncharacterized protein LOC130693049 isoform X2 [Daphnia carinata]
MTNRCGADSPCFDVIQLSSQSDGNNGNIFFSEHLGETFAIKKFALNCNDVSTGEQHWEKLIKLRYDHLVQYHQNDIHQDTRYLVMELCQGSMLDYCRGNLDENVTSLIKGIDIMWQITCGVEFLHRYQIDCGDLKLENVLFWKRNPKSKRIIVKISGYGYKDCPSQDNMKTRLGSLYYAAATKEETVPNEPITFESLTEIDVEHRALALDLITFPTKAELRDLDVATLLRHPVFILLIDEGRSRLITELQKNNEMRRICKNKDELEKWERSLDKSKIPHEEFDDLKDIMLSDNSDITKLVGEAFKVTPMLFSKYIWHIAISFRFQNHSIEIQEFLGKGQYAKVSKCNYTDGNGNTYPAACKKCSPKPDAIDVFNREVQTLRQLNHLFVIKYLDLVEKQSKKFIVMELCEGSLKDYVEGKLERIPKHSLEDKILISQVALGIAYIHSKDIIHKDLKLANILLWCHPSNSSLVLSKIADFGFAKGLKPDQSQFSDTTHPGTEKYMAPELLNAQGSGCPASFASDVYAFGIIIARIVKKGDHPFGSWSVWRKASMEHGLLPQNLQDLSWDLKDLILRLIDNDPVKRPKMALVLRHPYFVLTNDRTKRYFVHQLWADTGLLSQSEKIKVLKKIFSSQNLEEWHRVLSDEKQYTTEEMETMGNTLQFFRKLKPDVQTETVYPEKEYTQDIKEVITSEYDAIVRSQIDQVYFICFVTKRSSVSVLRFPHILQVNSIHGISRYSLVKLIQRSPKLLVPYLWSHLHDIISLTKPSGSSANEEQNNQRKVSTAGRTRRLSSKTEPVARRNRPIVSEIEWSSLFCEDELVDGLWNMKYLDHYNNSTETDQEIIGLVANCNMTERVWSAILDQPGRYAPSLLGKIVQSTADNGPKLTQMLLERHGDFKELPLLLHLAACNEGDRAAEIVQVLLKHGINPNAVDTVGLYPIHYAAGNESPSAPLITKFLLQHGANQNATSTLNGSTPVLLAASNQGDYSSEIVKHMLDRWGTPNANELVEALKLAVVNSGDSASALVDLLLERKGNGMIHNNDGKTLAHIAVSNEGVHGSKIMEAVLKSGVEPNSRDNDRRTPLHLAALKPTSKTFAIAKVLLENGGDPNAIDAIGNTPVHYAAANKEEHAYEMLKLLLSNRGNDQIKGNDGLTPVHLALINMGICGDKMRKLVAVNEESANVRLNSSGETLLHRFVHVSNAQLNIVQSILDHGGNPNVRDKQGRSPLHVAILNHSHTGQTILQMLLEKGGNPNLADKEKRFTPVHYVADSPGERAVELMTILLENKGDANTRDNEKMTPVHLAARNSGIYGPGLVKILLDHGGNPNAVDIHRRNPLHWAINNENDAIREKTILLLLEKGGNPNAGDKAGRTPVFYVVCDKRSNSLNVLKLLVKKGGDIFQNDCHDMNPILHATRTGSKEYCLPEVKKYLTKLVRNTKNVPESKWMDGLGNILPKYLKVNFVKRVPVAVAVAFAIIFISFLLLLWYSLFMYLFIS